MSRKGVEMTLARIRTAMAAVAGVFGLVTLWELKDAVVGLFGLHVIGAFEHGLVALGALTAAGLSYAGYKEARTRLPGGGRRALRP
ncbi:MAG: hypothetical protein ACRD6W_09045 [Nitrososphaerales archaeon]